MLVQSSNSPRGLGSSLGTSIALWKWLRLRLGDGVDPTGNQENFDMLRSKLRGDDTMRNRLRDVIGRREDLDSGEFKAIVLPLLDRLYRTALVLTMNSRDAENLVLDTYMKAWSTYYRLKPGDKVDFWMFRVLASAFSERYRNGSREESWVNRQNVGATSTNGKDNGDGQGHISDVSEDCEEFMNDPIIIALTQLPKRYRNVVLFVDVSELQYEEVADLLDCPVESIRVLLHRGRTLLAQSLALSDAEERCA